MTGESLGALTVQCLLCAASLPSESSQPHEVCCSSPFLQVKKPRARLTHLPEVAQLVRGQAGILIQVLDCKRHALSMVCVHPWFLSSPFLGWFSSPGLALLSVPLRHPPQPRLSSACPTVEQRFQCSHCSKRFATERLLRDHMRNHGERPAPPTSLPTLQVSAGPPITASSLLLSVNHYKCPLCDMTCPLPSSLRNHMRFRHSEDRPFKCDCCEYR